MENNYACTYCFIHLYKNETFSAFELFVGFGASNLCPFPNPFHAATDCSLQGCAEWGRCASPIFSNLQESLSKGDHVAKELATVFSVTCFCLVTVVGQLIKTSPPPSNRKCLGTSLADCLAPIKEYQFAKFLVGGVLHDFPL